MVGGGQINKEQLVEILKRNIVENHWAYYMISQFVYDRIADEIMALQKESDPLYNYSDRYSEEE